MKQLIVLNLAFLLLAGCASPPGPFDAWIEDQPDLASYRAAAEAPKTPPPRAEAIDEQADVDTYLHIALNHNPALAAARQRIERMTHRIAQAERLDDPMFSIGAGDMAQTAAGQVDVMTSVSQKLPLPQKLSTRGNIAAQDVAVASAEYEQEKLRVIADVRRAYWSYYYAVRAIEVTESSREILRQFRETADTQFRAGRTGQQDLLRISTELGTLDGKLIDYRQQRDTAAAMLNRLMNRPPDAKLPAPARVELEQVALSLDQLLTRASQSNPSLDATRARIEQFRQRLKLARLDDWPDLTLGVNYAAVDDEGLSPVADGEDQWWLSAAVNLPLWREPREAAQREALRGIYENLHTLDAEHNRIAFRVRDALARVEAQQKLVMLFRDQIIPEARQTLDVSVTEYTTGRSDFLNLIDNWRKLLAYELMQEQNLAAFERALADLQQAVGRDLDRPAPDTPSKTTSDQPDKAVSP